MIFIIVALVIAVALIATAIAGVRHRDSRTDEPAHLDADPHPHPPRPRHARPLTKAEAQAYLNPSPTVRVTADRSHIDGLTTSERERELKKLTKQFLKD